MSRLIWKPDRVKIGNLKAWTENPRMSTKAQAQRILKSLDKFGQVETLAVDAENNIINGHQRYFALMTIHPPEYEVDARRANRVLTDEEKKELTIALHTGATGSWNWDALSAWQPAELQEWGMNADALKGWNNDANNLKEMLNAESELGVQKGGEINPRILSLDIIYTLQMADCTCCLAVQAGWKYGINSAHYRICPYTHQLSGRHEVAFIDNDYFKYDHQKHLEVVRIYKPKYCTVRDVMTEAQCQSAGIAWYPLEKILEWAEELSQYAENVIIIPKYDCIKDIPEKFMLGYSIPTSHGGTPLPIELFKGRRIHLLGGSWAAQLDYLAAFGEDVVSLDNNHLSLMADKFGRFDEGSGEMKQVKEIAPSVNNVRYIALALSFGAIASKVNSLYDGGTGKSAEIGE